MILYLSIICAVLGIVASDTPQQYESNIIFYGLNSKNASAPFISNFNQSIVEQGCDPTKNFTVIAHGWMEGFSTPWVRYLITKLLEHRGGCVFFMDYSKYANVSDYFQLTPHFDGISAVMLKKVKQIGNYDRQFFFGFSFGSRLSIDVGNKIGNQSIARMDLCDPAGPGFDTGKDPKPAAKVVSCIDTSTDKGTGNYNCHQNFIMGRCGSYQDAAGSYPVGSHGLCPYFYNLAFTYNYTYSNNFGCSSGRMIKNPPASVKMGYLGDFNRTLYVGDIFINNAKYPPYIIENNLVDNQLPNLLTFMNNVKP
jgi:hypothetical protein